MRKMMSLGVIAVAAWVAARHRRGEVDNVHDRCAAIDWFAASARKSG